jgi:hypothetical protein
MDSRRVMRFLVGFALVTGAGCSYLPYALPDIGSSVANPVHNFWFRHQIDVAADEAWRKVIAHCGGRTLSSGYAEGFHTGFVEYVEAGGDGYPPTAPPYCMRCDVLRSPDRQQLIIDYYAGYKHGTEVAKFERLRDLVIVPLGRQPQPTSPGFTITPVPKDDPRQPDPFAPQGPLPPGFRTSPGDAPNTQSSVAPQPQELPVPRKAPAVLDKAPDAPAVTPMPTVPVVPVMPPPALAPQVAPPAPAPLDPKKLPVLRPEPEAEAPLPDPQSRLRSSQSSLGSGSPRPLAVVPPPYVPVPIQPPPTVVPAMAISSEESEPSPRPSAAPVVQAVKPIAFEVPTPISLPELPTVAPVAMRVTMPVVPSAVPAAVVRPLPLPIAEPVDGPVTGTADGLDDDDQPGETRGTTSTRDLDGLRQPAAPSSSEDDDDR